MARKKPCKVDTIYYSYLTIKDPEAQRGEALAPTLKLEVEWFRTQVVQLLSLLHREGKGKILLFWVNFKEAF